jgi:hypothetical protein
MKHVLLLLFLALVAASLISCNDAVPVATEGLNVASKVDTTGNGAPSGKHYNLNLIAVPKAKSADMTGNNGHRIFVKEGAKNVKINLTQGDFQVLDANGTDGSAAFQLPNPDPDCDGITEYSVYIRALGKPGGKGTIQSCYTDVVTGEDYCAADVDGGVIAVELERKNGKPTFTNVSRDLLYVDYCESWTEVFDSETGALIGYTCDNWGVSPLFMDSLADYYWNLDNDGLKHAQMRFYEVPTETGWTSEELVCDPNWQ